MLLKIFKIVESHLPKSFFCESYDHMQKKFQSELIYGCPMTSKVNKLRHEISSKENKMAYFNSHKSPIG